MKELDIFYADDWKELEDRVKIIYNYEYIEYRKNEFTYKIKQIVKSITILIDNTEILTYNIEEIFWVNSDIMSKDIYDYAIHKLWIATIHTKEHLQQSHLIWEDTV